MVEGHTLRIPQGPGWVFGDVALLFNSPRTASVVASSDAVLYGMDRSTFLQFVMRHAQVGVRVFFGRRAGAHRARGGAPVWALQVGPRTAR